MMTAPTPAYVYNADVWCDGQPLAELLAAAGHLKPQPP